MPKATTFHQDPLPLESHPSANSRKHRLTPLALITLSLMAGLGFAFTPYVVCAYRQSPLSVCKSNLKNLGIALEMYAVDHAGRYPPSLEPIVPAYLKAHPVCPTAGRNSYRATFGPSALGNLEAEQDYYLLECAGSHHQEQHHQLEPNYPAYNSIVGVVERPVPARI